MCIFVSLFIDRQISHGSILHGGEAAQKQRGAQLALQHKNHITVEQLLDPAQHRRPHGHWGDCTPRAALQKAQDFEGIDVERLPVTALHAAPSAAHPAF
jgi:hypothetical protein